MSRILEATCSADGKVTCLGVEVSDVIVMSEGKQASSGVLIIDGSLAKYIALSASDLKTTLVKTSSALEKVAEALTTVASTLTAIGAGMTGATTAPPPTLGSSVSTINSKVSLINTLKTELNDLSGALK